MYFVKITSEAESDLTLHAQSSYAQVELKEKQPMTDSLAAKEMNRYSIISTKNK